jgi:hypothetical protein
MTKSKKKVTENEGLLVKLPKGKTMWVCLACGKRSNDLYGNDVVDRGWDELRRSIFQ